jgi:hypothetical protein
MRVLAGRRYRSGTRWCVWRWTEVEKGGEMYLTRLHLIATPWFAVMLHWIHRPDPDAHLHDHPVDFVTVVLRGGYVEERPSPYPLTLHLTARRFVPRFVPARTAHRVVYVEPNTTTLVFAGPVVRPWGYHTEKGWIPWREYQG